MFKTLLQVVKLFMEKIVSFPLFIKDKHTMNVLKRSLLIVGVLQVSWKMGKLLLIIGKIVRIAVLIEQKVSRKMESKVCTLVQIIT